MRAEVLMTLDPAKAAKVPRHARILLRQTLQLGRKVVIHGVHALRRGAVVVGSGIEGHGGEGDESARVGFAVLFAERRGELLIARSGGSGGRGTSAVGVVVEGRGLGSCTRGGRVKPHLRKEFVLRRRRSSSIP